MASFGSGQWQPTPSNTPPHLRLNSADDDGEKVDELTLGAATGINVVKRLGTISADSSGKGDYGAAECPELSEMPKTEGADSVGGGLRNRNTPAPVDTGSGSVEDSSRPPMSPNSFPSTPDKNKNMSGATPHQDHLEGRTKTRESLKAQKKTYRSRKKEAAKELMSSITDPSVVLLGDWLKVRGTLKSWTKLWCVLKPGILILYKSDKHKGSQWVGTILLNTCQLLERPSKKDGFCFKLFHPLDQSIWATRGPKGETIGAFVQPLPYSYCIFRAPSESAGKCWMDALELALKCTNLLKRSMTRLDTSTADAHSHDLSLDGAYGNGEMHDGEGDSFSPQYQSMRAQESKMNESDLEQHFANQGLDDDKSDREDSDITSQSEFDEDQLLPSQAVISPPEETHYVENVTEELGQSGDNCQTEEVTDENKGLIWTLVKQVRPGMDLSKVVLPTFILEPRSFLDKLSDYYYHADILSEAVTQESPYNRMKYVVRWYLSGFYKKPKGLKKPYNPVIGETYRCFWYHPRTGSRTFYMAEQVSHHPPISVFHVTNRKDGFNISGSILARSKFYGNSLSAILDGVATLSFLERGEDYFITMPYAHCKGILIGTLTMELGGKVTIECPKTGYKCELEFKLKPFLGSGQASNRIHGKITMGADTLAMLDGHWDQEIYIKDRTIRRRDVFWNPTHEVRSMRLKRYTVPVAEQKDFESEKLWQKCSLAIVTNDMHAATREKFAVEEEQRNNAKERKISNTEWVPRFFEKDYLGGTEWIYKHADDRPWDLVNDVYQYEKNFVIQTQTRHKTPHLRATSINSLNKPTEKKKLRIPHTVEESDSSAGGPIGPRRESDSSDYVVPGGGDPLRPKVQLSDQGLQTLFEPLIQMQEETNLALRNLQQQVARLQHQDGAAGGLSHDWVTLAIILIFQIILQWIFR